MAKASEVPIRPVPTMAIVVNGSSGNCWDDSDSTVRRTASPPDDISYTIGLLATLCDAEKRLLAGGKYSFSDICAHNLIVGLSDFGQSGRD